jgi:predicted NBD/HSP70 family sugar kinase
VNFVNPGVIVVGGDIGEVREQPLAGLREVLSPAAVDRALRNAV